MKNTSSFYTKNIAHLSQNRMKCKNKLSLFASLIQSWKKGRWDRSQTWRDDKKEESQIVLWCTTGPITSKCHKKLYQTIAKNFEITCILAFKIINKMFWNNVCQ